MEVMGRHEVPEQNLLLTEDVVRSVLPEQNLLHTKDVGTKCVGEAELQFYCGDAKPRKYPNKNVHDDTQQKKRFLFFGKMDT